MFDPTDLEFWFSQVEMHAAMAGAGKQWTKRMILHRQLPQYVIDEIKDILRKTEDKAGTQPYKDLKERIREHFGAEDKNIFERAAGLTMTGKPSALAKQLVDLLCECDKPLEKCCCAKVVLGLWKRQLPQSVPQPAEGCNESSR